MKLGNPLSGLLPAPTRRQILQAASALLIPGALPASTDSNQRPTSARLTDGWEFHRGAIGGVWEVWRGGVATSNVNWTPVTLPHCFNARDAVDPDREYYEGPAWYRKTVPVENPYPRARTLLHFEGAGQRSEIFVGLECVGRHLGGYDEFTVDITDTAGRDRNAEIAVLCDNSRDLETIPSDLSDFIRYGGLYRHVNLLYVPAIYTERLHVETTFNGGEASIELRARLGNPTQLPDQVNLKARILDPSGKVVGESEVTLAPWTGERKIAEFKVAAPALWSPAAPSLYRCLLTLDTPHGA